MVCHEASYLFAAAITAARVREVYRLDKAEACTQAGFFKSVQIFRCRVGVDTEGEEARVGRDDELRVLPALESQLSAAVSFVAIIERRVERVKRAFGYAPQATATAALFLNIDAEFCRFKQQTVPSQRQERIARDSLRQCRRGTSPFAIAA